MSCVNKSTTLIETNVGEGQICLLPHGNLWFRDKTSHRLWMFEVDFCTSHLSDCRFLFGSHSGFILMERLKEKFKDLSLFPGSAEPAKFIAGCNLLKCDNEDILTVEELKTCLHIDSKRYNEVAKLSLLVLLGFWSNFCSIICYLNYSRMTEAQINRKIFNMFPYWFVGNLFQGLLNLFVN